MVLILSLVLVWAQDHILYSGADDCCFKAWDLRDTGGHREPPFPLSSKNTFSFRQLDRHVPS